MKTSEFKTSWEYYISHSGEWHSNHQLGALDEFLYRARANPYSLTIWHHPKAGYLSVQIPKRHAQQVKACLPSPLPDGMRLTQHPSTVYLDAVTLPIDMSSPFEFELSRVEAGMAIARQALDLVERALRNPG